MQRHTLETTNLTALGHRLQEARKARGLTQQQAADSLGVARTTVTAIEKGSRRVRPGEIIRLARLYARSVSSLVGPREPVADFAVQFRAAQGDEERVQAIRDFQSLCEDYLYLEILNGDGMQRSYPPQYAIGGIPPDDAAEDVASSERNRLGLGDGPVSRLRETLENDVGIRVFYHTLPSRVAGAFSYTEELGGCILVNAVHPEERRRWSMAHEYGHFLTSRFRSELTILGAFERVPASERFADAFARSMLMPTQGLRRRFHRITRESEGKMTVADVCRLAHHYFVSVEAMTLRLEGLRLLPSGSWERLRGRGFKVREAQDLLGLEPNPHDDRFVPLRYQFLAIRAYEEGNLTEGELARLLRTDRVAARRVVQELTHPVQVLGEGEVSPLPVNLALDLTSESKEQDF